MSGAMRGRAADHSNAIGARAFDKVWAPASLLVVAALFARVTGRIELAAGMGAWLCVPMITGRRAAPSLLVERAVTLAGAAAGVAAALLLPPRLVGATSLRAPMAAIALGALAAAATRLLLRRPQGGALATAAAGLLALTACGETLAGRAYVAAILAHVALALLALRAADPGRPRLREVQRRGWLAGLAALGVAAAAAGAGLAALPPLFRWSTEQIVFSGGARTGFSDRLWLGSLSGMLQSEEPVVRLHGPATDYLRGAVYDHYEGGRWTNARVAEAAPVPISRRPRPGAETVLMTVVDRPRNRYFLPLGARDLAMADGDAAADPFGTLRPATERASVIWFTPSSAPDTRVAPPGPKDLAVPDALRGPLGEIVAQWTSGAVGPAAKVEAIATRLQADFTYSLEFKRRRKDPLLDFLLDDRRGHCEYFASAAALLSRAAGVPARVVAGYRVAEQNPIDGHYIVRERNAHAWVEVHLPGVGWRTVDATPPADLPQNAPHAMSAAAAAFELAGALWARAMAAAPSPGPEHLGWALGALVVAGAAARALRRRAGRGGAGTTGEVHNDPPPPSFLALTEALARQGIARAASEPLEQFASRVEDATLGDAAALLRAYAALRYGGLGDAATLSQAMDACAARLRRGAAG